MSSDFPKGGFFLGRGDLRYLTRKPTRIDSEQNI